MKDLTVKSQETIENGQAVAQDKGHQELKSVHILSALLNDGEGTIPLVISRVSNDAFKKLTQKVSEELGKLPVVSGSSQVYSSSEINQLYPQAKKESKAMGDEFVSVEHLFLAMFEQPIGKVIEGAGIKKLLSRKF